jgi:hypothetical protein
MTHQTASATVISRPAPLRRARRACDSRVDWGFRRIQPDWWPLPTEEEVAERIRNYRGFFARLTPEQRAAIDAWDGPDPDVLGDPNGPKRTF